MRRYGASTEWLARNAPHATVYAVDLWDEQFILKEQADHYRPRHGEQCVSDRNELAISRHLGVGTNQML